MGGGGCLGISGLFSCSSGGFAAGSGGKKESESSIGGSAAGAFKRLRFFAVGAFDGLRLVEEAFFRCPAAGAAFESRSLREPALAP
jgi:hypothetical protein